MMRVLVAAASLAAASCALVRTTPDDASEGGAPSDSVGAGGTLLGGQGLGGAPFGGAGGAGGVRVEPSLPPCFPQGVDDFSSPATSAAAWSVLNATFVADRALLGVLPDELAMLEVDGTLDGACFISFTVEPLPDGDDAIDVYLLVSPMSTNETFDDLDVNVTPDAVKLYVRPGGSIRSVARTGNRFLLVVDGTTVRLYQTTVDGSAWAFADTLETPFPLADSKLRFTHYEATPAFFVDEVSVLPPELAQLPAPEQR
jgi:hypothetical protein